MECHPEEDNHCKHKTEAYDTLLGLGRSEFFDLRLSVGTRLLLCLVGQDVLVSEAEDVVNGDT